MQVDKKLEKIFRFEEQAEELKNIKDIKQRFQMKNKLHKNFLELLNKCTNIQQIQDFETSENIIDLLEMFLSKYKLDELFETSIDCHLLLLQGKTFLLYKKYQYKGVKSKKIFQQICQNFNKIENEIKNYLQFSDQDFFQIHSPINPKKNQIFGQKPFQNLNYALIYIESLLQSIVIYKEMEEYDKTLEQATKSFNTFKILFKSLSKIFDAIIMIGPENLKNFQFSSIEEFQNLQKYVEYIINKVELPDPNQQTQWEPESGDWKFYKENLEKFWISKLRSTNDSDYLVPKINLDWVKEFHISQVVKIKNYQEFLQDLKTFVFNQNFIVKSILTFSCCVFSIAAENRSITKKMLKEDKKKNENSQYLINSQNIFSSQIEKYIQKNKLIQIENFVISKLILNKAVEILMFGFPLDIDLLNHFKNTYKNNYSNIDVIPEVSEKSKDSIIYSKNNQINSDENDSVKKEIQNLKLQLQKEIQKQEESKSLKKIKTKSKKDDHDNNSTLFNRSTVFSMNYLLKPKLKKNKDKHNMSFETKRLKFQKQKVRHNSGTFGQKSSINTSKRSIIPHEISALSIKNNPKKRKKEIPSHLKQKNKSISKIEHFQIQLILSISLNIFFIIIKCQQIFQINTSMMHSYNLILNQNILLQVYLDFKIKKLQILIQIKKIHLILIQMKIIQIYFLKSIKLLIFIINNIYIKMIIMIFNLSKIIFIYVKYQNHKLLIELIQMNQLKKNQQKHLQIILKHQIQFTFNQLKILEIKQIKYSIQQLIILFVISIQFIFYSKSFMLIQFLICLHYIYP